MAVKLIEREWRNSVKLNINTYQLDSADDFPLLPEADPGSRALVADKSKKFIVNTAGVWVEDNRPGGFDVGGTGAAELPFGETTTVKEVLAECQPEFNKDYGNGVYRYNLDGDFGITHGVYTVNWNGTDYVCETFTDMNLVCLGNPGITDIGENTGEPFVIHVVTTSGMMIDSTDGPDIPTISIRQEVTEVKKISGKYVEGMGYVEAYGDPVSLYNATHKFAFNSKNGCAWIASPFPIFAAFGALVKGEKYTVVWDGVTYADLVATCDNSGNVLVGASNWNVTTPEMPFCIRNTHDNGAFHIQIYTYSEAATHTVEIIGKRAVVYKISSKYLTDEPLVVFTEQLDGTAVSSCSFGELIENVQQGKQIGGLYRSAAGYSKLTSFNLDSTSYKFVFHFLELSDKGYYVIKVTLGTNDEASVSRTEANLIAT